MITIDSLTFTYHRDFKIQSGSSFELREGKHYYLIGPSGSGKSTFLRLLAGLEIPNQGEIRFSKLNTTKNFLRLYMSQRPVSWEHMTAEEHLNFLLNKGKRKKDHPQTRYWLESVGLAEKAKCKPYRLSGGERQRLALACALAVNPDLLLLDEPFASLDVVAAKELSLLAKKLTKKRQTVIVEATHYIHEFDPYSPVILIENGMIEYYDCFSDIKPTTCWRNEFIKMLMLRCEE